MAASAAVPQWAKDDAAKGEDAKTEADWMGEIQRLLVAAGYFRARIAALRPFDKIVGGLAWSINASFATEVEVDLFLREDAKLGEKLQLAERIEQALHRMRCPHVLHAHQVEGLDYSSIFPVVRWLLSKVLEAREQFGDQRRRYSQYACAAAYGALDPERRGPLHAGRVRHLEGRYGVSRQFRRRGSADGAADSDAAVERRVALTLMEYGHTFDLPSAGGAPRGSVSDAPSAAAPGAPAEPPSPDAPSSSDLAALEATDGTLTGRMAAALVGAGASEIRAAAMAAGGASDSPMLSLARQREALRRRVELSEREHRASEAALHDAERTRGAAAGERDAAAAALAAAQADVAAFEQRAATDPGLCALEAGLRHRRDVQREAAAASEAREAERGRLEQAVSDARARAESMAAHATDGGAGDGGGGVEAGLRREVAKATRACLLLRRRLDDVPNAYELAQYARQIESLHEVVNVNLVRTKVS